jgi:hypothetical protein
MKHGFKVMDSDMYSIELPDFWRKAARRFWHCRATTAR